MSAKLVVTARKGGSRIALVGASGKELLSSVVFSEPRAKGATLRSLKGLLGEDIVVEDHTVRTNGTGPVKAVKPTTRRRVVRPASTPAAKPAKLAKRAAKR